MNQPQPQTEERQAGRPPYEVTEEVRERVRVAAGGGMSHEGIAMVLGISIPTLRKYFLHELGAGAHEARLEVIEAMREAAVRKGNVSAARLYLEHAPEDREVAPMEDEPPEVAGPKLGKKEQQDIDAKRAADGTDWAGLLPAHNVVSLPKR